MIETSYQKEGDEECQHYFVDINRKLLLLAVAKHSPHRAWKCQNQYQSELTVLAIVPNEIAREVGDVHERVILRKTYKSEYVLNILSYTDNVRLSLQV